MVLNFHNLYSIYLFYKERVWLLVCQNLHLGQLHHIISLQCWVPIVCSSKLNTGGSQSHNWYINYCVGDGCTLGLVWRVEVRTSGKASPGLVWGYRRCKGYFVVNENMSRTQEEEWGSLLHKLNKWQVWDCCRFGVDVLKCEGKQMPCYSCLPEVTVSRPILAKSLRAVRQAWNVHIFS